jgi:hypothetical protein
MSTAFNFPFLRNDNICSYQITRFHIREDCDCDILGCDTVTLCKWTPAFRRNIPPPLLLLKSMERESDPVIWTE